MKKIFCMVLLTLLTCITLSGCNAPRQSEMTPTPAIIEMVNETSSADTEVNVSPSTPATPEGEDAGEDIFERIFVVEEIPEEVRSFMKGKTIYDNSPIGYDELSYLTVTYWGYDDRIHTGNIIVNNAIADDTIAIFQTLLEHNFPIEKIKLPDYYDGKDELSMQDNNTSGFNDRPLEGSNGLSYHQLGLAIDINPLHNPCIDYRTNKLEPSTAEKYLDRSLTEIGMIFPDDICVTTFKQYGFTWGGDWYSIKDYQHFEKTLD